MADINQSFVSAFELTQAARSMQESIKMEREREDYFQELYDDIRYFGYRYSDVSDAPGLSPSTESNALDIIDCKQAYDLRIIKLRKRYKRWRAFLQLVDSTTADVLESHFEKGITVKDEVLRQVIRKAVRAWEGMEQARGKEMDEQTREAYEVFRKQYPELFKKRHRTFPHLIDGEIRQLTYFEYEMHQSRQRDERYLRT